MKKKILMIDDDERLCEEVSEILRDEGYYVSTAKNGLEGSDLILSEGYDVIILDLKLPGLSGFDILEELKGKRPGFYVIVVSGQHVAEQFMNGEPSRDEITSEQYSMLSLADAVIAKPFNMSTLLKMIQFKPFYNIQ